ncbi:MAG: hypothetical protein M1813_003646 [Trichoglossum hirsutum]|nr:MAG: hypothetical protein M1813_003646 [Trichoglossum hirsutum]
MIQDLRAGEIDVGIGLTEGWVAGLGKKEDGDGKKDYQIVGTYVETPLCWAISTGVNRKDITSVSDLKGTKIGVSRIGSGSHVMGFVLADAQSWLQPDGKPPFPPIVLGTFANLRDAVNNGTADFFMWEHFTSKRYYDNGSIKRVGEIYTPWSSWKIVAPPALTGDPRLETMFESIDRGIEYFEGHQTEAVDYISTALDYSKEDAAEWLGTVRFARGGVRGVDKRVVDKTIDSLRKAGVIDVRSETDLAKEMVGINRS